MFDIGSARAKGTNGCEHASVEGTEERERGCEALWIWTSQA